MLLNSARYLYSLQITPYHDKRQHYQAPPYMLIVIEKTVGNIFRITSYINFKLSEGFFICPA